ncbi:MAG: tRNA uridine-5-carboxymethylaminomethyl(34) synthesis enzyme MnmG [Candidatus Eremiobacteraeota bacterium]|nr:tRNA uridine-5-carboxymethylaminomethyl(34) synthesis enzyme MnmG [Candidatus Eremiobacteraeota bacterium]
MTDPPTICYHKVMRKNGDDAVIVVGGGHAGVEAALAAARLGVPTLLITGDPDRICTLPCNPSIGGSAKGQLVREIDALGGEMGLLIDASELHVRMLNESKGPAVRALRALADKPTYMRMAQAALRNHPHLRIEAALVERLLIESGRVRGVVASDGRNFFASAVVLATGTFLGGKTFRGSAVEAAGRVGEAPAIGLANALREAGFPTRRLKTGTPPRIDKASVDYAGMEVQDPSASPLPFSYRSERRFAGPQLPCHITLTNERTHRLVRDNLHRSPLYGLDLIRGIGPRYCPSIEDKVVKFAHNPAHQIFIEPEGWNEPTLYVGGFSTSLPAEVQLAMLRTLPGLEESRMIRAGYAVEYDMVPPTELHDTLETRRIGGLFHCGQLNGTSGYEEAAAQGLVAGANAALAVQGRSPLRLPRSGSYIGTMIDDLVNKGVDEPYRMLTSRAEHRVVLRHDNADARLTPIGHQIGLVSDASFEQFQKRRERIQTGWASASGTRLRTLQIGSARIEPGSTVTEALRRPGVEFGDVRNFFSHDLDDTLGERLTIEIKCEGYVRRQELAIEKAKQNEEILIPQGFAYQSIRALSNEAREKLSVQKPRTLGAAGRIPGVNPADVAVLSVFLHTRGKLPAPVLA